MTWQKGLVFLERQQSCPVLCFMEQWAIAVEAMPAFWQKLQGVRATRTPAMSAAR